MTTHVRITKAICVHHFFKINFYKTITFYYFIDILQKITQRIDYLQHKLNDEKLFFSIFNNFYAFIIKTVSDEN
jgi:hypothetical protein